MDTKTLRVGMIGAGSWAKRHLDAWQTCPETELVAIYNRTTARAQAFADEYAIPDVYGDVESVLQRADIDIVSISMPHNLHHPIAMAAIAAGKHVFCEKPLAMDAQQAREMWSSAQRAGIKTGIQFGHRVSPAAVRMRELIQEGAIGEVQYVEGSTCYDLGSDPAFPLVWRFSKQVAGAGALADLGVYAIDAARWLVGEFTGVSGQIRTWIKHRPLIPDGYTLHQVIDMYKSSGLNLDADMGQVDNDDECLFLASFVNGAQGYFKSSRLYGGEWGIKVYGSRGSLEWEGNKLLGKQQGEETLSTLEVPALEPAPTIVTQFVTNILNDADLSPTFYDGLQAQEVMDAVIHSAEQERWVSLSA